MVNQNKTELKFCLTEINPNQQKIGILVLILVSFDTFWSIYLVHTKNITFITLKAEYREMTQNRPQQNMSKTFLNIGICMCATQFFSIKICSHKLKFI